MEIIQKKYPTLLFKRIIQTHSDIIVESSLIPVEADAHYTAKSNEALLISTADCMPIMIYCRQTKRIAAVHAGWRGVENKIIKKTLQQLISTGSTTKDFKFWIGPHILQDSFEVDLSTFQLLSNSQYSLKNEDYVYTKNNKYYVNLLKIVRSQIINTISIEPDISITNIDTKINSDYYSYRRNNKAKERNLSFICLLS